MLITNTVLVRGAPRFTQTGQRLPDSLHDTDQTISPGLVKRLVRYALRAMDDAGFVVEGWACEVYTMDGDETAAHRMYCVEFTNAKGGALGIQGILTHHGHPCLAHGYSIDLRSPQSPSPTPPRRSLRQQRGGVEP